MKRWFFLSLCFVLTTCTTTKSKATFQLKDATPFEHLTPVQIRIMERSKLHLDWYYRLSEAEQDNIAFIYDRNYFELLADMHTFEMYNEEADEYCQKIEKFLPYAKLIVGLREEWKTPEKKASGGLINGIVSWFLPPKLTKNEKLMASLCQKMAQGELDMSQVIKKLKKIDFSYKEEWLELLKDSQQHGESLYNKVSCNGYISPLYVIPLSDENMTGDQKLSRLQQFQLYTNDQNVDEIYLYWGSEQNRQTIKRSVNKLVNKYPALKSKVDEEMMTNICGNLKSSIVKNSMEIKTAFLAGVQSLHFFLLLNIDVPSCNILNKTQKLINRVEVYLDNYADDQLHYEIATYIHSYLLMADAFYQYNRESGRRLIIMMSQKSLDQMQKQSKEWSISINTGLNN